MDEFLYSLATVNKRNLLEDLGLKDYKETWDYQEQLFQIYY